MSLISTSSIAQIISNGICFDMKNWNDRPLDVNNLPETIDILFDILSQNKIPYLLVGGIALLSYIEGRNTQDIDLILSRESLDLIPDFLILEENNNFIRGTLSNLQIALFLTENKLFDWVRNHCATERSFGQHQVRCATVEGLILLKLFALPSLYRQGNFNKVSIYEGDLTQLLLKEDVDSSRICDILAKHLLSTDFEEVQNILMEIQDRIKRFQAQKNKFSPNS